MMIKNSFQTYGQRQRWICIGRRSGALILEEYELQLPVALLYIVGGGGMSADAYHITAPHPDGLGANVMLNCLRDAG
jgi:3-oxoacyl-[acyl-carrier-protein] synthase II